MPSGLYRYTTVIIPNTVGDYFLEWRIIKPNKDGVSMVIGIANINLGINTNYTITYNANGGTPSTQNVTKTGGSTLGTLPTVTKDGCTFLGWYTAKTGGTEVTSSTKVTGNVTYYAQWFKPEKLSLVLRANGGKFSDGSENKITEHTTNLSGGFSYKITEDDIPARSGYTFLGYAKTDSATTANYVVGDMLNITSNTTLYAIWKEKSPSGGNTEKDTTPPTISSVTGNPTTWTSQNVTLTVTATDAGSGLASSAYSFDGGATWQKSNKKAYSANTNGIVIKVRDVSGNIATFSKTINITKIDKTAPSVIANPPLSTLSYQKNLDVQLTIADTHSGMQKNLAIYYAWTDSKKQIGSQGLTNMKKDNVEGDHAVTFTIPSPKNLEGEYYLLVEVGPTMDVAGNTFKSNSTTNTAFYECGPYYFDNSITQAGTIKAQIDNKEYTSEELKKITTDKNVKVILNQGKDNASGIKNTKLEIKKDGSLLTFKGTEVNLEETGTYKITVTTEDKVGNIAVEEYTIIIIERQPKISFNPNSTIQVQKKINVKIDTENIDDSEVYYIYLQAKEGETEESILSSAKNDSSITWKKYKDTGIELSGLNGRYRIIAKVNLKNGKQIYKTSGIYEFDNQVDKVATLSIKLKDKNGEDYKDKTTEDVYIKINNDAKDKNGVKESYFTIDGKNGKVTDSTTLKEKGTYKITVTTVDNLGNVDTNTYNITIEEKAATPVDPNKPNEDEKPNPDVNPDKPNEDEKPNPDVNPDKPNEGEKPNPDVEPDKPNEGEKPNPDVEPDKPNEDEKLNNVEIPYLGSDFTIIYIAMILVTFVGIICYINYKKYKAVR